MTIYRFDEEGIYTGSEEAFLDHNGNPLMPPYTTTTPPPSVGEREAAVWHFAYKRWEIKADFRDYEYYIEAGVSEAIVITEVGVEPPEGHSTSYIPTVEDLRSEKAAEIKSHYSESDLVVEFNGYEISSDKNNCHRARDYLSYNEERIEGGADFDRVLFERDSVYFLVSELSDLRELCTLMLENIVQNDIQLNLHLKNLSELNNIEEISAYDYRLELS